MMGRSLQEPDPSKLAFRLKAPFPGCASFLARGMLIVSGLMTLAGLVGVVLSLRDPSGLGFMIAFLFVAAVVFAIALAFDRWMHW